MTLIRLMCRLLLCYGEVDLLPLPSYCHSFWTSICIQGQTSNEEPWCEELKYVRNYSWDNLSKLLTVLYLAVMEPRDIFCLRGWDLTWRFVASWGHRAIWGFEGDLGNVTSERELPRQLKQNLEDKKNLEGAWRVWRSSFYSHLKFCHIFNHYQQST